MITKELFGNLNGTDVFLYTLKTSDRFYAQITNYGGIIKRIVFDDVDVVLGRDTVEEYTDNTGYYGAIIGRNSNRIENAEFYLNGKLYKTAKNDNENNLHGGISGFDKKIWDVEEVDGDEPKIVLTTKSPDGEEGFPGNLEIKVTYTVTLNNSLKITYEATSDQDTLANFTNHSYFNLNGHSSGTIDNHILTVNSHFYSPNKPTSVPTGEILASAGTVFDATSPVKMKDIFTSDNDQIKTFIGLDHNFALDGRGFRKVAQLTGDLTGIKMDTYTDMPGMHIYTGNFIKNDRVCKDGAVYDEHYAMCFETQFFPNAVNISHLPAGILKAGDKYESTTEFVFYK